MGLKIESGEKENVAEGEEETKQTRTNVYLYFYEGTFYLRKSKDKGKLAKTHGTKKDWSIFWCIPTSK